MPHCTKQENILDDLLLCYEMLTEKGFVGKEEMPLVKAWCEDITPYL